MWYINVYRGVLYILRDTVFMFILVHKLYFVYSGVLYLLVKAW